MWNSVYNYFFFSPTHIIRNHPIGRLNGLGCELLYHIDHYFDDMETWWVKVERPIPVWGGGYRRRTYINAKYLKRL